MTRKFEDGNGYEHKCLKCGYEWIGYKEHPTICARCMSKRWNTEKTEFRKKSLWVNDGKVSIDLEFEPNDARILVAESMNKNMKIESLIMKAVARMICADKRTSSLDILGIGGQQ
jgi:hypothetical protein